jgi:hypothetical protein
MASFDELKAVKRRHAAKLLRTEGVSGVDIDQDASGKPIIAIHLESNDPEVRARLPDDLEGHPLKFIETGPIRKQKS